MFNKGLFVLLVSIMVFAQANARQSCDWPFKTQITINETSGLTTSDYSVKLTLTGASGGTLHPDYEWSSDGADLRIFASDDTSPVSFSISSWNQAAKEAEVWVTFASFTANSSNVLNVYYGNSAVPTADGGTPPVTYVSDKIKFHTRYNTADPASKSTAKALFDAQSDSVTGYGCTHPTQYNNIQNSSQNPGNVRINFIAYSTALFTVPADGVWGVRYGADYGLGGGLYVDGIALDERWDEDLWWGGSDWNNGDVLSGTVNLTAGEHKLEIIGAEGGNDGGLTIQFYRGSTNEWQQDATNLGISIRSEACPLVRHTIQYGAHDVCSVDLSVDTPTAIDSEWFVGSENNMTFQVAFESESPAGQTAASPTQLDILLPSDVSLIDSLYGGTNWSCTGTSGLISCAYGSDLSAGNLQSSVLTLYSALGSGASAGSTISVTATVSGNVIDEQSSNDQLTHNITVRDTAGLDPSCSSPKQGLWARFFDTTGSSVAGNATQYDTLISNYAVADKQYGQTVIGSINGSGNPFDPGSDPDYFVVVFEGYIYVSANDRYYFGVDGDDAVEVKINDDVISADYGAHGPNGGVTDKGGVNLNEGFHKVEFRLQEIAGGDLYQLYWSTSWNGGDSIVPASAFYHCAGSSNIEVSSDVSVVSDDINGVSLAKAIPNAIIKYTVTATNKGNISTDLGSTVITQKIDDSSELFVKDLNAVGEGPINFIDGLGANDSGLSYSYDSNTGSGDSLWFSVDGMTFTESTDLTNDYNSSVSHFQIRFDGTLKSKVDATEPYFQYEYQVRVK